MRCLVQRYRAMPAYVSLPTTPIPPGIQGVSGAWVDRTPAGVTLDPDGTAAGVGQNFGGQGVQADRTRPGTLYASFCYQGLYKSTDYGVTWARVTPTSGSDPAGDARSFIALSPDGTYMLATALSPLTVNNGAWKTLNGGQTWARYATGAPADDMGGFWIHPTDNLRVLGSAHTSTAGSWVLWESRDGGETWTNQGAIDVAMDQPHFAWIDADTILAISDGDTSPLGGTWRGVRSGSVWPWTWTWTSVSVQQHWHGGEVVYVNPDNGTIFHGGSFGIYRSTDHGANWTQVTATFSGGIVATETSLYSMASYATTGSFAPNYMTSDRAVGTTWSAGSTPGGIINGWLGAVAVSDGRRWAVFGACWNAGLWEYVE